MNTHSVSTDSLPAATRQAYPPGDLALWIFILAELAVFALFFIAYAYARAHNVELFDHYQATLDRGAALANTLALISASYFVVLAVRALRQGDTAHAANWLWGAVALALLFLLIKGDEYAHHLSAGVSLSSNTFYMFYLSLTFFHFLHVVLGMLVLAVLAVRTACGRYHAGDHADVESGAAYWHMVDLVWLVLFPLIYVMR